MAFDAVMLLWNSRSMASLGTKGAESMLGIFCHILRHTHQVIEAITLFGTMTAYVSGVNVAWGVNAHCYGTCVMVAKLQLRRPSSLFTFI